MKGTLVFSNENNLGTGKLIQSSGDVGVVEYFKSISERVKKTVKIRSLKRVLLQKQTRCYIRSKENQFWQAGRIGERDELDNTYEVNLPGNRASYMPEEEIYVRCNLPVDDPIETLVLKSHETPFFHERRFAFVKCLTKQRAVAHGMTGLLSSNITLYPHQAEVTRRILEDPIQRYLLADEVGLGKTIEAGIVLRQYLLDEPKRRAVVLTPIMLVEQWKYELEEKFNILDFGNRVYIASTDELIKLRPLRETDRIGMVIVDEAHHIAAGANSSDPDLQKRFLSCQQLAHHADRLLLLSATPVLNNEKDFLAMLHLLDPVTYKLNDFVAFRDRVNKRQDIGRTLLSFREGAAPFVLKTGANRLRTVFPDDERLHTLLNDLQQSLQSPEADVLNQTSIVRSIRTHVSDTYRLHRRMLRSRRDSVALAGRWNAERAALELKEEYDYDERGLEIQELLDEWRVQAVERLLNINEGDDYLERDQRGFQRIFLILFRASGTWLGILRQVIEVRLALAPASSLAREFRNEDLRILCDVPLFEGEKEILRSMLDVLIKQAEDGDRVQLLVDMLRKAHSSHSKVVVFTSFEAAHDEILSRLREKYGVAAIASHDGKRSRNEVEEDVERFRDETNCFVLISDSSGEEGRNLQFADWLIHFDLPWSPNRLEQRIGRLDRIGRGRSVQTRTLLGPDSSDGGVTIHEAWYRFLKDGLGIFEHSVASLQFFIDDKLPALENTIFLAGSMGLLAAIETTREEIKAEQLKINEQNALDEIDTLDKKAAQYFDELIGYDGQHEQIKKAAEDWICQVLRFGCNRDTATPGIMRYSPNAGTLVPSSHFIEFFAHTLSLPGTYNRTIASRQTGISLYRLGEQFTDALNHYIHWDDRGQAFAMWRQEPSWSAAEGSEWIGFRFNYVIETDLTPATLVLAEHGMIEVGNQALARRADALFPPFTETIYIDTLMQEVENPKLLKTLTRPYSRRELPNRDYSLDDERLPVIERLIGIDSWANLCRESRSHSETLLRGRYAFRNACEQFAAEAARETARRVDQLRLRFDHQTKDGTSHNTSLALDILVEQSLGSALVKGIHNPRLRLDSVGFIVVSGRIPQIAVNR